MLASMVRRRRAPAVRQPLAQSLSTVLGKKRQGRGAVRVQHGFPRCVVLPELSGRRVFDVFRRYSGYRSNMRIPVRTRRN